MIIKLNNQEIVCQNYKKTSDTLKLIGVETEDGLTDMTLKGVNWGAVELPTAESLDELKAEKLNTLNNYFGQIFAAGYYDETTEWTLFCGESNVLDYATLKNAIMDMDESQVVEIGTFTGWQTSTKAVVYPLLKRYSLYMLPLTTTYRKLKTMIEYCDTKENLELIVW